MNELWRAMNVIIDSNIVLDVNEEDCREALKLPMQDYEDALLAYCAKRHMIDYIVTRNLKDFVGSPVKATSPEDFLKIL